MGLMSFRNILLPACFVLVFLTGCVPEHFMFDREIGKAGSARGEFLSASDLALTRNGNVVIADAGNNRIQIISPEDGSTILAAGEYGTTGFKIQGMAGLGVHPVTDDIWVCDQRGNKLVKFSPKGETLLRIAEHVKYPIDVAIDRKGTLYVLMSKEPKIYKFDQVGKFLGTIGGTGKTALIFGTSIQLYEEDLYIADYGGKRVVKLSTTGEFIEEFTQKGEYEEMRGPSSIFVDSARNMYLLDLGEVPVVMLSGAGELISKVGTFGSENGQFLYPRGIVARSDSEILVLDNSRNVILSFKKKKG